jgi:hypothetical protein
MDMIYNNSIYSMASEERSISTEQVCCTEVWCSLVEAVRGAGRPVDDGAGEEIIGGGVVHPAVQLAGVLHTDCTHTTRGELCILAKIPPPRGREYWSMSWKI